MLRNAPKFEQVAQTIFDLLDGQIWCGYNIISFDNEKLRKEFEKIGGAPPKPSSIVDVYPLLSKTFGKRAGDMKLASLGRYFSLGEEKHRSIDDCRMTLEVFKNCCLQLFLEEHCGLDLAPTTVRPEWSGKSASSSAAVKRQQPQRAKRASSVPLTNADANEQPTPQTTPKSTPQSTPSKVNSAHALSASVVDALHDALSSSKQIWIAYDGGSNAGVPRQIQPTKWINEPVLIAAVCSVSQSEKYFATRKIVEVRETYWRREMKPLTPLVYSCFEILFDCIFLKNNCLACFFSRNLQCHQKTIMSTITIITTMMIQSN